MGSTFGIISLVSAIIGGVIFFTPITAPGLVIILLFVAILFGIIGIISDDSKAPGLIGLLIGIGILVLIVFTLGAFINSLTP